MPGIVGGEFDDSSLSSHLQPMLHESWYTVDRVTRVPYGLGLVSHGETDPRSDVSWVGDGAMGALHGILLDDVATESTEEFFESVLENPSQTLADVDGLFSLACVDWKRDRVVVATDKLGSRPCYYTTDGRFRFASEVKSLVSTSADHRIDRNAIADLLSFGYVFGDKTLVEDVAELRPARVLTYADGSVSIDRYWDPGFELTDVPEYVDSVLAAYRKSVHATAEAADDIGIWLSGGLDSRILAGTLTEVTGFRTMTYDIPGRDESGPAKEIAKALGVANDVTELGPPSAFASVLDEAIALTDGMICWTSLINTVDMLTNLQGSVDVMFEAAPQDTFLGHDLWERDYDALKRTSTTDALFERHRRLSADEVHTLLNETVTDPKATLREEVSQSEADTPADVFRDVTWQSLAYSHLRSSQVPRSQVGTRITFVDSELLETAATRPQRYNRKTVPMTSIPRAATRVKFEMIRKMNRGLDDIEYQLTGIPPSYPQWLQTVGMGIQEIKKRIQVTRKDGINFGSPGLYASWYRDDSEFRERVDTLLDDANSRSYINADAVNRLRREHLKRNRNAIDTISAITTVESWRQQYLE
ncbi:asparagine synthase-related protein [Salinigranum halophilum]|uniref:asparagine synthase-related protein n=1 Tax=Salinigranum halophilum TaxID=2565931 RepID=UPI0010A8EBEE|nr:asparagine synthase-related protein [Salinigranum halophilum]